MVIYLRLSEPEKVFMIRYDMDLLACALQDMAPDGEVVDDGQHFLIINLIVLFCRVELSAVESD